MIIAVCLFRRYYWLVLLLGLYSPLHADQPKVPTYLRHVSVNDGLSQITVADILQDAKGFMWFATQNGINRYDGYSFIQYKRDKQLDGSGPVGEFAYKLALDPTSEDIWVATSGGLSRYQYSTNQFKHYILTAEDGEQRTIVPTVVVDRNNQLWVGTRQGLFAYDAVSDDFTSVPIAIDASSWVVDIERDASGDLLVATTEGLFSINERSPEGYTQALTDENVTDIELLSSGEFWVSTMARGILRKPDGTKQLDELSPISELSGKIITAGVNSIKQLSNGDIWLSSPVGLSILRQGPTLQSSELYYESSGLSVLSAAHMTRTYESKSGVIWQGTWTNGFSIFDPSSLQIKSLNAASTIWVRGLTCDDNDNIWFGTNSGIWKYEPNGQLQGPWSFPAPDSPDYDRIPGDIRSIIFDPSERIFWVGTTAGLYIYRESDTSLKRVNVLPEANVFHMNLDSDGDLWVGTFNSGLYRLNTRTLDLEGHWSTATVAYSYVANDDYVLTGTIEGLMLIDKETGVLTNLYDANRPIEQRSPRVITWISAADENSYWLGTQGSGVYKMTMNADSIRFEAMNAASHLATLSVGGIQQDQLGDLWVSTTEGISHVNSKTGDVSYLNKKNGAFSEGYYINHSVGTERGEIFFGSPRGISHFYPEDIQLSDWKPEILFTNLRVLNKAVKTSLDTDENSPLTQPIHIAKTIQLDHTDNVFSIEFSALDYTAPDNIQYAYRLNGFDQNWNTVGANHRMATYTNLDPGVYKLEVRGTNKDGIWSDKLAQLDIIVRPPWYWNNVSITFWILSAIVLMAMLYRWRIWTLKARTEELGNLVEQRTRDLEESNRKLQKLSSVDELTGLRNRRDFRTNAELELDRFRRSGNAFCILMLDIDHFKDINDELGHSSGDTVLVECADVMKRLSRKHDLLARWGGEEFILLAINTNMSKAVSIAEKLRKSFETNQIAIDNKQVTVTVTIGVSEITAEQTLDDCIKVADDKLYKGKRSGRNSIIY